MVNVRTTGQKTTTARELSKLYKKNYVCQPESKYVKARAENPKVIQPRLERPAPVNDQVANVSSVDSYASTARAYEQLNSLPSRKHQN